MLGIFALVKFLKNRKRAQKINLAARTTVEQIEARVLLAGNGLTGTYFDNVDFSGKSAVRIDPTLNFDWGANAPGSAIAADTFSVRWTGQVQAAKTEAYTF